MAKSTSVQFYQPNAFVMFLSTLAAVFVAVPLSVFLVTTLVAPKLQAQTALNAAAQKPSLAMAPVASTTASTNCQGVATPAPAAQTSQANVQTNATVSTASFMKPTAPTAMPSSFTQTVKNYAETNIINSNNTVGSYNSHSYSETNVKVHKTTNVNSNNVNSKVTSDSGNTQYNQVNVGNHNSYNNGSFNATNSNNTTKVTTNVNSNNNIGNTFNNHSNNGNNSNNTTVDKTFNQTNNLNSYNATAVDSYNATKTTNTSNSVTGVGDITNKVTQS